MPKPAQLSFNSVTDELAEKIQVDVKLISAILRSSKILMDMPNACSSVFRSSKANMLLIETSVWVLVRQIALPDEIYSIVNNYDKYALLLKMNHMPININLVRMSLVSIERFLPQTAYLLWFKRCKRFLECIKALQQEVDSSMETRENLGTGRNSMASRVSRKSSKQDFRIPREDFFKSQDSVEDRTESPRNTKKHNWMQSFPTADQMKQKSLTDVDKEFEGMFILVHEYLLIALNAVDKNLDAKREKNFRSIKKAE